MLVRLTFPEWRRRFKWGPPFPSRLARGDFLWNSGSDKAWNGYAGRVDVADGRTSLAGHTERTISAFSNKCECEVLTATERLSPGSEILRDENREDDAFWVGPQPRNLLHSIRC